MKQYLLTLFCLCVSMIALAQQKTITGTVIDANNEPVIGASVLEKGTSNGTITNLDGEYSLSVSAGATLVFSYIGYKTQEVSIGNKTTIKITLVEDSEQWDEVVVVGYGVQKKSNITGSVASVKPETFKDLDSWTRHRLRAIQLKHWRTGTTVYSRLRALGANHELAAQIAGGAGHWWGHSEAGLNRVLTVKYFDELGIPRLT